MDTVISVKIDKATKEAAQEVAQSAGLNLSSLVKAYLRQVVSTRKIEIYAPEPMTPELAKIIARAEAEVLDSPTFDSVDDFLNDLKKNA